MKRFIIYLKIALFLVLIFLSSGQNAALVSLTHMVLQDYPKFDNQPIDDWEKVKILRQWAHKHIEWSTSSALIYRDAAFKFYDSDALELFNAFDQDKGGVWCEGAAYALMKLYRAYGFESYVLDMGKVGVMTHATTLVKINYQGRDILALQGPTFDLNYTDSLGAPYDYFDFLQILKNHNHDLIIIEYGTDGEGYFLTRPNEDLKVYDHIIAAQDKPIARLPDGRVKYVSHLTRESFKEKFGDKIFSFLQKEGHPPHLKYLHLYPLNLYGPKAAKGTKQSKEPKQSKEAKELMNKIKAILKAG